MVNEISGAHIILSPTGTGKVGVGSTSLTRLFEVNGQMRTTNDSPEKVTSGSWTGYSDQRLKKDIASFKDGLTVLRGVNPVTYKFNGIGSLSSTETHIGVIAQDIMQVAPYCIGIGTGRLIVKQSESTNFSGAEIVETLPADTNGEVHTMISPLTYNYDGLIYVMINSIKQLDSANTALVQKDSIKDTKLNAMLNQDSINNAKIQAMQNQLDQLLTTINTCCTLNGVRSTQSQTNNQSQSLSQQINVELNDAQSVILQQNVPNPFAEQTTINYSLPDNTVKAQMLFYNAQGKLIQSTELTQKGKGTLNVFASDLSSGIYTYTLVVDGKIIETKKMVKQ